MGVLGADGGPGDVRGPQHALALPEELEGGQAGADVVVRLLAEREQGRQVGLELLPAADGLEAAGQPRRPGRGERDGQGQLSQRAQGRGVEVVTDADYLGSKWEQYQNLV